MMKLTGITLHLSIIVLMTALALVFSERAEAHVLVTQPCDRYYNNARPGEKWQARFDCIQYVKAHNAAHACRKPRPTIRPVITVKHIRANLTQRKVLTEALNGHRRTSTRHLVAMVAAIIQESTAYNNPWGHGSSVGVLQLTSDHGDVAWRMKIINSTTWFISGAKRKDRGQAIGDLSQAVQGSAHPTLYHQWVPEAYAIVAAFKGSCR